MENLIDHKEFTLKLWKLFYLYSGKGTTWFRFFSSWGVHIQNLKVDPYIFYSERHRLTKWVKIGKYKIKILKP